MSTINQIVEDLRQKSVTTPPGERLPSIRSLMKRYATSLHSVNVAIRRLETEGLIDVRVGSGMFVSAKKEANYIELHRPRYPSRSFDIKEFSLGRALERANYKMLVQYHNHDYDDPEIRPNSRASAYVVLSNLFETSPTLYKQLTSQPAPIFAYGRMPGLHQSDYITGDDYHYLSLLIKHLLSLGHRHIAFLDNEPLPNYLIPRREMFLNIVELFELPQPIIVDCHTRPGENSMIKAYEGLTSYLRKNGGKSPFTALISSSPSGVISAMRALHEAGISVPEDCSLCCFGVEPENAMLIPAVTEVGVDEDQWGEGVVEALQRRLKAPDAPAFGIKLPPKLHIRESTQPPHKHL